MTVLKQIRFYTTASISPFGDLPQPLGAGRPACFDSVEQFEGWQELARKSAQSNGMTAKQLDRWGPCLDCTRKYQQRMIAQMRCARPTLRIPEEECERELSS